MSPKRPDKEPSMIVSSTPRAGSGNEDRVALGPDLPMAVFTSTEPWHAERIGALALYCSDGRWGDAFDEFCHKCLLIPRYDRWAVPGGPEWLAMSGPAMSGPAMSGPAMSGPAASGESEEFAHAAREQLDFLIKVHGLERIVLITHYGCAAYARRLQRPAQECLATQIEDLRTAANVLEAWHPGMRVEGYLAMLRGRSLSFHEVDVGASAPEPANRKRAEWNSSSRE
jgi:hypothetical protein